MNIYEQQEVICGHFCPSCCLLRQRRVCPVLLVDAVKALYSLWAGLQVLFKIIKDSSSTILFKINILQKNTIELIINQG